MVMHPMLRSRRLAWSVLGTMLALSLGCSGGGGDRPKVVPVTGVVLHNGSPVEGAVVTFRDEGQAKPAVGTTDSSGRFELTSYEPGDGAAPGKYVVTIAKIVGGGPDQSDTSMEAAAERENVTPAEPEHLLPQRYASPLQSGLEETVTEGGPNDFKFELTD